jgi:hypothetical protein
MTRALNGLADALAKHIDLSGFDFPPLGRAEHRRKGRGSQVLFERSELRLARPFREAQGRVPRAFSFGSFSFT